jgi:hypothetical protein
MVQQRGNAHTLPRQLNGRIKVLPRQTNGRIKVLSRQINGRIKVLSRQIDGRIKALYNTILYNNRNHNCAPPPSQQSLAGICARIRTQYLPIKEDC